MSTLKYFKDCQCNQLRKIWRNSRLSSSQQPLEYFKTTYFTSGQTNLPYFIHLLKFYTLVSYPFVFIVLTDNWRLISLDSFFNSVHRLLNPLYSPNYFICASLKFQNEQNISCKKQIYYFWILIAWNHIIKHIIV